MRRTLALAMAFAIGAMTLAGSDSAEAETTQTPPQDQFGEEFAAAFNAPETGDPIELEPEDASPDTPPDEPIDF